MFNIEYKPTYTIFTHEINNKSYIYSACNEEYKIGKTIKEKVRKRGN